MFLLLIIATQNLKELMGNCEFLEIIPRHCSLISHCLKIDDVWGFPPLRNMRNYSPSWHYYWYSYAAFQNPLSPEWEMSFNGIVPFICVCFVPATKAWPPLVSQSASLVTLYIHNNNNNALDLYSAFQGTQRHLTSHNENI